MSKVKLFILADSEEDFDKVCEEHGAYEYNPELLLDVAKLDDYNNVEIWDSRKISRELEECGYEFTVM